MRPDELLDLIQGSGEARRLLRLHPAVPGLNEAYFRRVQAAYYAEPAVATGLVAHWRAFAESGDDPAYAYRAKGIGDLLAGRWGLAAAAFRRAGALARDPLDRLTHPVGAITALAKAGRIDEAAALGQALADGLDALDQPALAARARLNAAIALDLADRNRESRGLYARAIPALARAGLVAEEAGARLGLSNTHLHGGDPAIAEAEATAARALALRAGMGHIAILCEVSLAHALIVQGRADEAFARLLELRPRLEGSPTERARVEILLGNACLHLNLFAEAAEAYAAARQDVAALSAFDRAYTLLGLGEAAAHADAATADGHLAQAAVRYGALGNRPWRAAALAARAGLRPAHPSALRLAQRALDEAAGSPYHETVALLVRAEVQATRGVDASADLRRADGRVRRYGYRRFAWRLHHLRARAADAPLPHYRRMVAEILRERLAVTSVAARAGFLSDKSDALGGYLAHLLDDPTPRRVAEARETIRRTRAATLLDEILHSGQLALDPARRARLEALREQVALDATDDLGRDVRAGTPSHPPRRGWTEATHALGALDAALPPAIAEGCVLLTEADGRLWAIVEERAVPLGLSASELEEMLRWLRFEIYTPMADRDAPSEEALELLAEMREALVVPWLDGARRPLLVCPDGVFWRVPWDALLGEPATLLLHPSLVGGRTAGAVERVAVWMDDPGDLPSAAAEARTLRERFPQACFFRTRAEVIGSFAGEWDLVHVVGHARHNPGNPMFSALHFADGPLYAAEIARGGLRARLACLSACETGMLSLATREEPDGLVRAFLARGAEAVLASLWPLDDEAAARFFATFYAGLTPGRDLAETVAEARQAVRDWRTHPYFWASLSLFGGYRP